MHIIKRTITGLVTTGLIFTASCASIVSKNTYPVNIQSTPSNAGFTVKDASGSIIHQGVTPSVVNLKASAGFFKPASYVLTFNKSGQSTRTHQISATMDGWYLGNILFGGIIGMLIVDPATGNMWAMEKSINVHLADQSTAGLTIKDINTLSVEDRKNLIPLT